MVINPRFAVGISILSVIVLHMQVFPVSRIISGYESLLESPRDTFFELDVVENPRFAVKISTISITLPLTYFRFGWPYCYFRLSVVLEITVFEIATIDYPSLPRFAVGKKYICRLSAWGFS